MRPLALNVSKMKKVGGDKDHSVFQHPDGHQIRVAHAPLSALQRKQIEKMPVHNYAHGDEVNASSLDDSQDSAPPVTSAPETSLAQDIGSGVRTAAGYLSDLGPLGMIKGMSALANTQPVKDFAAGVLGSPAQADDSSRSPSQNAPVPAPASAEVHPSAPLPDSGVDINSAYKQGQNAITEQQGVSSNLAKSQAEIQKQDLADRQAFQQNFQNNAAKFEAVQRQMMSDMPHIDPKHYVENMSVPAKIASAIGMILGGAGAGANQPNPGMEFLNKQIERDIQAQQSRIDTQKTLLGANQALFHDQMLRDNMTRVNMNDIYDHKIQMAAAAQGTQQAKAAADAAHSKFALENAQLLQQSAIRKTVMDHMNRGGGGLSAVDLAHAGLIPESDAMKEQASIDAQNAGIQQIKGLYGKLAQVQTLGNRAANPIQSASDVDALNAQITNAVMGADVSKRLTPESAKLEVLPFHVNLKDNHQTVNNKMMGVMELINQHNAGMTPMMNRYSPQSLPKYPTSMSESLEGKTASDAKGNRIIMKNGRWEPYGG